MIVPVSNATTFEQIINYYYTLTDTNIPVVEKKLANRFSNEQNHQLNKVINITKNAPLLTLLVIDAIECYGRGSDFCCDIAFDYLYYIKQNCMKQQIDTDLELCEPYSHKNYIRYNQKVLAPALSYHKIGELFKNFYVHNLVDEKAWRLVYFITNAIYHKEQREASSWFESAKSFFITSIFEEVVHNNIDGLELYERGVRHDMYCPVPGTGDPDFCYSNGNGKFTAEFKRALKTVPAIARHASTNPSYIYNANYLVTYGIFNYYPPETKAFYMVDYNKNPYVINRLDISSDCLNQYIEYYGEWLRDAIDKM